MDQKTADYIKTSLSQGKSKEEIYKELLAGGTTIEVIQESFDSITSDKDKEDTQQKTIRIILVIATILVGAGIFSFIASNWQGMTKPLKIFVILTAMLSAYSSGWYVKEKLKLLKTGDALILLGSVIYGAGVFLVAQMFNIRANWPDGFILWMLGVIAMAYATESFLLFYLAIPLGLVAVVGHPFGIFTSFTSNFFLLTSSLLLIIVTIVTFVTGWVFHKRIPEELKNFN